ncbi:MAG TPA: 2OG-Fe(II) oxygenase [Allosphingosinicella sp.]|nr:2OG-Fe(II) oxygenase [Allosphingosinicella sp.]
MQQPSDLEQRAAAGDAEAQYALAARLLALADAPDSFARGAALVEAASANGHAEAASMLATLEAVGAGRRQDWRRAFECLDLAAGRGSEHARAQLRLLAGPDLDRLLRVPARVALSERPRLRVFPGFASPAECRWVIDRLRAKLAPAMVWDEVSGAGKVDPVRSNSAVELRLTETDVAIAVLRARISAATRLPEPIFEIPQVMHYAVGQEFRPHHDFLDPEEKGHAADLARRGQRIGTFLIYLNDDFDGGETIFPRAGLSHRGRAGDALFFANVTPDGRPDPLTVHAGLPPTSGEKWIFSQWIRDRLPAPPPA